MTIDSWVLNPDYHERNTLLITFVPHDDASKKLLYQLVMAAI